MPLINADRVNELFMSCHWTPEEMVGKSEPELVEKSIVVKTITVWVGFNPERVQAVRAEVGAMLLNLDPDFLESSPAAGMTFLRAVGDKNMELWGDQRTADRLMALGMALGWVSFPLPREAWSALPGSVPYVVVHDKKIKSDLEINDEVR